MPRTKKPSKKKKPTPRDPPRPGPPLPMNRRRKNAPRVPPSRVIVREWTDPPEILRVKEVGSRVALDGYADGSECEWLFDLLLHTGYRDVLDVYLPFVAGGDGDEGDEDFDGSGVPPRNPLTLRISVLAGLDVWHVRDYDLMAMIIDQWELHDRADEGGREQYARFRRMSAAMEALTRELMVQAKLWEAEIAAEDAAAAAAEDARS